MNLRIVARPKQVRGRYAAGGMKATAEKIVAVSAEGQAVRIDLRGRSKTAVVKSLHMYLRRLGHRLSYITTGEHTMTAWSDPQTDEQKAADELFRPSGFGIEIIDGEEGS